MIFKKMNGSEVIRSRSLKLIDAVFGARLRTLFAAFGRREAC